MRWSWPENTTWLSILWRCRCATNIDVSLSGRSQAGQRVAAPQRDQRPLHLGGRTQTAELRFRRPARLRADRPGRLFDIPAQMLAKDFQPQRVTVKAQAVRKMIE